MELPTCTLLHSSTIQRSELQWSGKVGEHRPKIGLGPFTSTLILYIISSSTSSPLPPWILTQILPIMLGEMQNRSTDRNWRWANVSMSYAKVSDSMSLHAIHVFLWTVPGLARSVTHRAKRGIAAQHTIVDCFKHQNHQFPDSRTASSPQSWPVV